jgi:cell division septum initiation protein DivIVA
MEKYITYATRAKNILEEAAVKGKNIIEGAKHTAENIVEEATQKASNIVAEAKQKAKKIAECAKKGAKRVLENAVLRGTSITANIKEWSGKGGETLSKLADGTVDRIKNVKGKITEKFPNKKVKITP